jgi:hypothetical protein
VLGLQGHYAAINVIDELPKSPGPRCGRQAARIVQRLGLDGVLTALVCGIRRRLGQVDRATFRTFGGGQPGLANRDLRTVHLQAVQSVFLGVGEHTYSLVGAPPAPHTPLPTAASQAASQGTDTPGSNLAMRWPIGLRCGRVRPTDSRAVRVDVLSRCDHSTAMSPVSTKTSPPSTSLPTDDARDYILSQWHPWEPVLTGLRGALAELGLLEKAESLDLRTPVHDYFEPLFTTGWHVAQLNPADQQPNNGETDK